MISDKQKIDLVRTNWSKASKILKFKFITPYKIKIKNSEVEVFAYLPDYGSKNGMILGLTFAPKFEIDKDVVEWAKRNEMFYSFININQYLNYNEELYKDTLDDWSLE